MIRADLDRRLPQCAVADDRPVAVLMGGAPGSGKTTLADKLGESLRLHVVSKDRLRQSTLWKLGTDDLTKAPFGPGLWYTAMDTLLQAGISVIGDMTLYRGVSESEVASRLAPLARLVQIHCCCSDPLGRWQAKASLDALQRPNIAALLPEVSRLCHDLQEPIDLCCPCLIVDTTAGYRPSIDELSRTIVRQLAPHLEVLGG